MVIVMTSELPLRYCPKTELQRCLEVCPHAHMQFFVIFHQFTDTTRIENPYEPPQKYQKPLQLTAA